MNIFEAIDIDLHVSESELATLALKAFREEFARRPDRRTFYIRRAHEAFDMLEIRLLSAKNADEHDARQMKGGVGGWMDGNDIFSAFIPVTFKVPNDLEKTKKYIASSNFESLFRHEFQHYLDKIADRFDFRTSINPTKDKDGYYNSDIEYSAYFKEQAEPLLAILRAAKAGKPLDGLTKIEPDFSKFIRGGQHWKMTNTHAVKAFGPKQKQRYLRDMAALHKAATAVSGSTAPFKPKALGRILLWLSDRTGIVI
jgi:hypothetical protein